MHCRLCQHENRSDARFCNQCGQSLLAVCAACGKSNSPESRYCDACGGALVGDASIVAVPQNPRAYTPAHLVQKILTTRSALEGERKQVTVLFCDMANSTDVAQQIGAEAMHELLNEFFALAMAEIHRLEGTVNQFLGDGFMALFGAPVAHEDHVRRALLAALAIQQKLTERDQDRHRKATRIRMRMGVHTGSVVVGKIGDNLRMDYTASGDTTHIAARMQQLAKPGGIAVSDIVKSAGSSYFDFVSLGMHALKGIKEPVEAFELLREHSGASAQTHAESLGIRSPLVGRERELAALREWLGRLQNGKGGAVILTGEPGAGKSRLVAEIRRQVPAGSVLGLEGRAVSFGRSQSYLPFIGILKSCFDISDDDAGDESWRKLERGLAPLFADRAHEILPYLATVLKLQVPPEHEDRVKYLDGQGFRRQVFLCMRQLFEQLALKQSVVLLLEDWHWADQSSVELAEHLLPLAGESRILFFFATRPDPDGPAARIRVSAADLPSDKFQEIALAPLTEADSTALVANLIGAPRLPPTLQALILHKTEGNPLFIEEVVRSLVTSGVLVRNARDKALQLAKPVEQVDIPDTIHALLLARIDSLEEEVKQVLKLASVIGRSFFNRILAAIIETRQRLEDAIGELEHVELIRQKQRLPELEYIFKHALVQEAAYGSILAAQRRAIHLRVAQSIEALFKERLGEFTSLLAHHYTLAEDWEKAQEYLFKAGDQAGRMAADTEALSHFRQAEGAYMKAFGDKLSALQRASLARKIGAALHGTGHYEEALGQFRRALSQLGLDYPGTRWGVRRAILRHLAAHFGRRLRRSLGLPEKRAMDPAWAEEISTVCHFMSWMDYFLDKERMVLDSLLELHAGEHSQYALAEARGLSSLGYVFMTFNARGVARRYHTAAGAIARRSGNPSAIAFAAFTLGSLEFFEGSWDACVDVLENAARAYREAGDIHGWAGAVNILSFVVYFRGDLDGAISRNTELIRAGQDAAEMQVTTWGYQNLGYPMLARGPLDQAVASLRRGQSLAETIPAWQNAVYFVSLLGKCLVLQGRLEASLAVLENGFRIVDIENLHLPFDQVELVTASAMVHLAFADRQEGALRKASIGAARRACTKSLKYARVMPGWLPEALRLQGTCEWLSGNEAAALKNWHESIALAGKFGFPVERARTWLEMAQRTADGGLARQACESFRHAGANVFLAFAQNCVARLAAQSGADAALALSRVDEAADALADVNAHYEHALACRERARLHEKLGQGDLARASLDKEKELLAACAEHEHASA